MKIFISNNINLKQYAQAVHCKTYILSSDKDKTLNTRLQTKIANLFSNVELKQFYGIGHEEYLTVEHVIDYIKNILKV